MSQHNNIPILPDSTGRRIFVKKHIEISYSGAASALTFKSGDLVTAESSGLVATVNKSTATTTSTGVIIVTLTTDTATNFTDGENLKLGGSTVAQVASSVAIYGENVQLVSYDNPSYGQKVDKLGAAYTRFADGNLIIDTSGRAKVADSTILGTFGNNYYEGAPTDIGFITTNSGSVNFESDSGGILLSCSINSGDVAGWTSQKYHKYVPGQSQFIEMSVAIGDTGKTNVRREWGYFDDDNGLFFRLDGDSLSAVVRTSGSSGVIEEILSQSAWNTDRFDGTLDSGNSSNYNLNQNLSNIITYWIDFSWPAGQVKWGIVNNNEKLVGHAYHHGEAVTISNSLPYIRTPSLPARVLQTNTGVPASISEARMFSTNIFTEGKFAPIEYSKRFSLSTGAKTITNTPIPVLSFRPQSTFYGRVNRVVAMIESLAGYSISGTLDEAVKVTITQDANLTGSSYVTPVPVSAWEADFSASAFSGGSVVGAVFAKGVFFEDVSEFIRYSGAGHNLYDGTPVSLTFSIETVRSGAVADVDFELSWREIVD